MDGSRAPIDTCGRRAEMAGLPIETRIAADLSTSRSFHSEHCSSRPIGRSGSSRSTGGSSALGARMAPDRAARVPLIQPAREEVAPALL